MLIFLKHKLFSKADALTLLQVKIKTGPLLLIPNVIPDINSLGLISRSPGQELSIIEVMRDLIGLVKCHVTVVVSFIYSSSFHLPELEVPKPDWSWKLHSHQPQRLCSLAAFHLVVSSISCWPSCHFDTLVRWPIWDLLTTSDFFWRISPGGSNICPWQPWGHRWADDLKLFRSQAR